MRLKQNRPRPEPLHEEDITMGRLSGATDFIQQEMAQPVYESTIDGVNIYRTNKEGERYCLFPVGREALQNKPCVFVGPGVDPVPAIEKVLPRFNLEVKEMLESRSVVSI